MSMRNMIWLVFLAALPVWSQPSGQIEPGAGAAQRRAAASAAAIMASSVTASISSRPRPNGPGRR